MHDGEPLVVPVVAPGYAVPTGQLPCAASNNTQPCERLSSDSLLAGKNEIEIQHGASIYRLRITSLGKLILTK